MYLALTLSCIVGRVYRYTVDLGADFPQSLSKECNYIEIETAVIGIALVGIAWRGTRLPAPDRDLNLRIQIKDAAQLIAEELHFIAYSCLPNSLNQADPSH